MPVEHQFERFDFEPKANDGSYQQHGDSFAAEFTQVRPDLYTAPEEALPRFVPAYPETYELSSDVTGTPEALASETADSQSNFADLQWFLMNNLETIGSRVAHLANKPWVSPTEEK